MKMEKVSTLGVMKGDMGATSKILPTKPKSPIDELHEKFPHPSYVSSAPIHINVPINPSLETIGALCELETVEIDSYEESEESDDENSTSERPDYFPQCLEDLIQLEHNYAKRFTCTLVREENKQSAFDQENAKVSGLEKEKKEITTSNISVEKVTAVNISSPVRRSKRQIEKQERELTEKECVNDVLQTKDKVIPYAKELNKSTVLVSNLHSKFEETESDIYCSNYKSFADFKKRHLKIVIEDCRYTQNLESANISFKTSNESPKTVSDFSSFESKNDIMVESPIENSEEKISTRSKFLKAKNITSVDINKPLLRKRKILKYDIKEDSVPSLESEKDKNVNNVTPSHPKHTLVPKAEECEDKQKENSLGCKKLKRSSTSSDNGSEITEKLAGSLNKRKKSVSFSDELILKKNVIHEQQPLIDSKTSQQKNIPLSVASNNKSQKKKVARRESIRLVVNEDEPPLFSQPDVMVKVKFDDVIKKEEKELEPDISDVEYVEVKNPFCSMLSKSTNQLSDEFAASGKETAVKQDTSNLANFEHVPSVTSQFIETKVYEPSLECCESTSDSLIKNIICEDKHQGIPDDLKSKNNLINTNIECLLTADNEDQDVLNISAKQNNIVNIDSLNDLNVENKVSIEVCDVEKLKPGRKSCRLIKKKEFFEDAVGVIENKSTLKYQDMKQNALKQNVDEISILDKSGHSNMFKKEERNIDINSDADIDTDLDESEEDDPDKLWCICRKPHNARFMIQCDKCEDWFHGTCVGVTKQIGRQLEKLKKEWWCPNCHVTGQCMVSEKVSEEPVVSLTEVKMDSSDKNEDLKSDGQHGCELAKETMSEDRSIVPASKTKELPVNTKELDHKLSECDTLTKESDNKSKEIDTKSKEFHIIKHSVFEKVKNITQSASKYIDKPLKIPSNVENINKNLDLKPLKSMDSALETKETDNLKTHNLKQRNVFLTSAGSPQKNLKTSFKKKFNSPIQITNPTKNSPKKNIHQNIVKQTHMLPTSKIFKSKQKNSGIKKKQSCVQCQLESKVNSCFCSDTCIDKHIAQCLKSMRENKETLKEADFDSQRLVVFDRMKGNVITNGPTTKEIAHWLKANPSFMIVFTPSTKKENFPHKKECDSSTGVEKKDSADEVAKATVRLNVRKTLKNILQDRCKNADDIHLLEEDVQRIANKIEEELHSLFKDNSFKYRAKYRSLMFNIKDPRNQGLFRKILKGSIPPDRLVHMSSEELASIELAKWREQENQHLLDLIKREQLEHQKTGSSLLLKKTHKGEVEIEDDLTSIIEKDVPKVILKDSSEEQELMELEKEEVKNTTHLHRSHLFDLNCKICTGKIVPPPVDESVPKKVRVAYSISVDHHSPNTSDSVERTVSKIVEGKSPSSSTGDDSMDQVPTSTVSIGSPEIIQYSVKDFPPKSTSSVWKGFIFMQDIAKFVTSAYKVSGRTDQLRGDLPDTIQICGRIIPDQVWDYLGKIKQSGNKELIIIHFQPANEEEANAYHSFYTYLSSRKRYGVVSNYSKKIKDFYLLPLAAASPVPMVLVPFDGPGLPFPRPHLLLGVIVCHKFKQSSTAANEKQTHVPKLEVLKPSRSCTPLREPRSYTPPLPTSDTFSKQESDAIYSPIESESIPEIVKSHSTELKMKQETSNKVSECTSLSLASKLFDSDMVTDDDNPYDPEQDVLSLTLEKKVSKVINISEKFVKGSDKLEQHKKILDALTRQVEETDRQVNALKQLISVPEEETKVQSPNVSTLDIISVAETGMSSFLDLPENLQEILNTVRLKSNDKAKTIHEKGDVDMRIKDLFGKQFSSAIDDKTTSSVYKVSDLKPLEINQVQSKDAYNTQAATPPPSEETGKPSISGPSDPRIKLRTTFHTTVTSNNTTKESISASKQALCNQRQYTGNVLFPQETIHFGTVATEPTSSWSTGKEPPPPGVESFEISGHQNKNNSIQTMPNTMPIHYVSPLVQDSSQQIIAMGSQQSTPFPTHLPLGFSIHAPPPPTIQHFPPLIVSTPFQPPPLPLQAPIPKETETTIEVPWPVFQQHSSYQSKSGHWDISIGQQDNRQSEFRHHSSGKSNEFYSEQFYKRGSLDQHNKQGYTRGHWNAQHQRGRRFENRRKGNRSTLRRQRN